MSAESKQPSVRPALKGILKKTSNTLPPTSPSPPPRSEPESQPEEPPKQELTRAELLLKQEAAARLRLYKKLRDTELKPPVPLETFELLSSFPRGSNPPPAHAPSEQDVRDFLSALSDFQPSEYLDLIEERNCLGKCGYTLCPRPRRTHSGPFKLSLRAGAIARTEDLNKWCSDACAERALYLKVQLDNPTYARREADRRMVIKLELRAEKGKDGEVARRETAAASGNATTRPSRVSEVDREELAVAMAELEIRKVKQAKSSDLALERQDPGGFFADVGRVDVVLKENLEVKPPRPPSPSQGDTNLVEGYRTDYGMNGQKFNSHYQKQQDGADSDDDDTFSSIRF
ncbi:Rtr1/RPAP2 family-domain-containing protein [Chaetomium strumarium]|uniref:RNA polymerase II subunit B1 CTD phosphatase RPAP2 homolog n=1 Tax=Chaetomium strumarium TaxID=1170767 RepID=A0AAJ0M3K3_9PEZI|nr:Rtr1/RPAP2 family-domain-containing protein [Chaetomium strumarium]